jgi:hypothetical protein
MVDQLWMWVLDEQTIITSFPTRYAHDERDLHNIHKSIRKVLKVKHAQVHQIRSIFDVSLIILAECANTLFQRTETHDRQPRVVDIFSEAIDDATEKYTISFQRLWQWIEQGPAMSDPRRSKQENSGDSAFHLALMDIQMEGKLQREVNDILDELNIMIGITKRQKELIQRFCEHVADILDPERLWSSGSLDRYYMGLVDDDSEEETDTPPQNGTETYQIEQNRKQARGREKLRDEKRRKNHFNWFRLQSQDLLLEVRDRIDQLEGLRESAKSTAQSVSGDHHLMDGKQG